MAKRVASCAKSSTSAPLRCGSRVRDTQSIRLMSFNTVYRSIYKRAKGRNFKLYSLRLPARLICTKHGPTLPSVGGSPVPIVCAIRSIHQGNRPQGTHSVSWHLTLPPPLAPLRVPAILRDVPIGRCGNAAWRPRRRRQGKQFAELHGQVPSFRRIVLVSFSLHWFSWARRITEPIRGLPPRCIDRTCRAVP